MKKVIGFAAAFALFATTQAFAIAGVGAHYVMNTGSLTGNTGTIGDYNGHSIKVNQKKAEGLQGIGFKAWIDFLPVVDIEGTLNVAATRYEVSLDIPKPNVDEGTGTVTVKDTTIDLYYSPDAPFNMVFDRADPLYGVVTGDISVTYPFDLIPIIRPYVGAGVSYFASIPIINASFAKKIVNDQLIESLWDPNNVSDPKASEEVGNKLVKALKDESYKTGIGGHVIAGLRIKLPIIPIAAYVNGKYYLGGNIDDQFTQGFVLEVGGGLAL
jgi:hypothetical protein